MISISTQVEQVIQPGLLREDEYLEEESKLKELKDPEDLARARIYDRVLERCVPILVNDQNVRKLITAQNISMAQKLLGGEVTA